MNSPALSGRIPQQEGQHHLQFSSVSGSRHGNIVKGLEGRIMTVGVLRTGHQTQASKLSLERQNKWQWCCVTPPKKKHMWKVEAGLYDKSTADTDDFSKWTRQTWPFFPDHLRALYSCSQADIPGEKQTMHLCMDTVGWPNSFIRSCKHSIITIII